MVRGTPDRPLPGFSTHVVSSVLESVTQHVLVADEGGETGPTGSGILTEGGDFLVTEAGDFLVTE